MKKWLKLWMSDESNIFNDWRDALFGFAISICLPFMSLLSLIFTKELNYAQDSMQRGVEAELAPPTQDSYNGIIKIRKSLEENPFAFTHEIIHYVFDVGVGNRVQTSFTRKAKGEPKDIHEQMIDYGAAANRMRYDRIVKDIERYDTASPRLNPASFVNELCKTYNADRSSVIRRIQEVRKISRKKSLV